MSTTSEKTWRDLRPGDRILERDSRVSEPKVVETVVVDQYILVLGRRRSRIAWRNLNRYRIIDQ